MVGKITKNEKKMFRTLLIMDTVRGEHSTGVVIVNDKGVPSIFKQVGNPYELFDSMKYNSGINGVCSALIGHNRYATKGAVNKVNAHPFNTVTSLALIMARLPSNGCCLTVLSSMWTARTSYTH